MSILRHPVERGRGDTRGGTFERFSHKASNFTSSPLFYCLCLALVAAFIAVHAASLGTEWELALDGSMSAVTLLLLALLKNSENQTEHAIQAKLDAIGRVLIDYDDEAGRRQARKELARAIQRDEDV